MKTVLVVDDEEGIRRLLAEALAAEFRVVTAGSGREALTLVSREAPDLIILDLALPGMDGIETLRRVRERGVEAKVVILTAYGSPELVRTAQELGVSEFLGKPFYLDQLVGLVREEVGIGLGRA